MVCLKCHGTGADVRSLDAEPPVGVTMPELVAASDYADDVPAAPESKELQNQSLLHLLQALPAVLPFHVPEKVPRRARRRVGRIMAQLLNRLLLTVPYAGAHPVWVRMRMHS